MAEACKLNHNDKLILDTGRIRYYECLTCKRRFANYYANYYGKKIDNIYEDWLNHKTNEIK